MKRTDLNPGDHVVLTAYPATAGYGTQKAAKYVKEGYWTAKVVDPHTEYPVDILWNDTVKTKPGVKVQITGYVPDKYDKVGYVGYRPQRIGNTYGGGTEITEAPDGHKYVRSMTERDRFQPDNTVTVAARLIVNTVAENERLVKKEADWRKAEIERAKAQKVAIEELAARYEALGIEATPSYRTVKIETTPEELIEIIEALAEGRTTKTADLV